MPNFPQQRDRFQSAEALFDTLPLPLTDGIPRVLRRARINRTPTGSLQILSRVRRDLEVAPFGHEICCAIGLVASYGYVFRARNLFQHHQRGIAFGGSVGLEHLAVHDQPVAVLYQQIRVVTQLGFLALALRAIFASG